MFDTSYVAGSGPQSCLPIRVNPAPAVFDDTDAPTFPPILVRLPRRGDERERKYWKKLRGGG